ncbi:SMP-30/gluconolactonase/LRE family protein [Phytoactinopolyspora sp. XMNu-373]|uniref:SMP-30/gluconolactonase/LRE family protein n=2 Tax=Phytoactinopolyspora mesophila TaxID=2650750 RepID=A0A7K3M949_9ACTN|nr:SMP-30/gluconolactonase/LRE family protein [Phytoactinopolyspora mesophila]NDL59472.1 SMP-30/gluconolactonase/LRE family protein [Phytoactinopolyspora mesophila]
MKVEQLTPPVCEHGEGPAYSPRWAGPRWVDMLAGDILEMDATGAISRRNVGAVAAVIRARRGGGWIVAEERRLAIADDDSLTAPLQQWPQLWRDTQVRNNEGGCDPDGNLYLGSMAYEATPGAGTLYRIDRAGRAEAVVDAVTISNGIGWSPDGSRAYYIDTSTGRIDVFDWSSDTGLSGRREWASAPGGPDGLAVDAEGGVWVAMYGGSAIRRYDSDGRLDHVVELPVRQPTAVAFVGDELRDLVITTSRHRLGNSAEPEAGALFGIRDVGVRGLPLHEFGG